MQAHLIEFITVGFGLILLMYEAFSKGNKSQIGLVAAAGLSVILVMLFCLAPSCSAIPAWMERFYTDNSVTRFYKIIAVASTVLVLLMAVDFRKVLARFTAGDDQGSGTGEFYCLPVFACAGLMWMASATDLVSVFVALELVTITFYVMVAFMRRNVGSLEAGVKYLILGALSTGFLVYGIAWLYGAMGTTNISEFTKIIGEKTYHPNYLLFGIALILIALGFKVGAVPMQLWIPDVYQGAPTPITAYLSVASKAAGFIVLITIIEPFLNSETALGTSVISILAIMAGATLLYGNLAAIPQTNFKRLLAYSSIAHAGFLLMGIASGAFLEVSFYLGTYLLMTFAAFFILALVRSEEESDEISAFDGLASRNPMLALALTIAMAALAGIPLTAGFWGKFFMFQSALVAGLSWWLIGIAFVGVAAGFYYYLKVVRAMYWHSPKNDAAGPLPVPAITKLVLILLTALILVLGIYPQPVMDLLGR